MIVAFVLRDKERALFKSYGRVKPVRDREELAESMKELVEDLESKIGEYWYWCESTHGRYYVCPCYGTKHHQMGLEVELEFPWDRGV